MQARDIDEARIILGLPEEATLSEIKESYRRLSERFHPDRYPEEKKVLQRAKMAEINKAYKVLLKYTEDYLFPLSGEEMKKIFPQRIFEQFRDDWLSR